MKSATFLLRLEPSVTLPPGRGDGGNPRAFHAREKDCVIVNSHDGTSAYQMFAGVLRFVCTNSMIAGERFEEVRVPHKGGIQDQIIDGGRTAGRL